VASPRDNAVGARRHLTSRRPPSRIITSIEFDRELYQRAKVEARRRGKSIREVIEGQLEAWLRESVAWRAWLQTAQDSRHVDVRGRLPE
jgi:hypothetical protein